MVINKEMITSELNKLIRHILLLSEVESVQVRGNKLSKDSDIEKGVRDLIEAGFHDCCSDTDLSVNIRINPKDTVTKYTYMKHIDRFGFGKESILGMCFIEENYMYRLIMLNGMRYDFGFTFREDETAPLLQLGSIPEDDSNPDWPMEKVNQFWFVQIQALAKLFRNDYLIADHLANGSINETLVQQMVLRDRQYGTNHHRYGHKEKLMYMQKDIEIQASNDEIFDMIAKKLYCAALTYDELTRKFYPDDHMDRVKVFLQIWQSYESGKGSICPHSKSAEIGISTITVTEKA